MMHCLSLSDAGDRERGQGSETAQGTFQAGMRAPGTVKENCAEVTGRLRWAIQISSDCLRDLAQLEGRSAQFFQGGSAGSRGDWQEKNCAISLRELATAGDCLQGKNAQFFLGSWQRAAGGCWKKTAQLLGGWPAGHPCTVSEAERDVGQLGTAHENCTVFRRSSRSADWVTG
jgi:hypothetical protein